MQNKSLLENNKNIIPALIISLAIVIAAIIYAYSTRYEIDRGFYRVDKWNGTIESLTPMD